MEQKFIQLTENFYYLEEEEYRDRPVLGYFKGKTGSVMIDGGTSIKHIRQFLDHLKENHLSHPDYCVLTHWHWDHIFGLSELNGPIIAHENTKNIMKEMENTDWKNTITEKDYPIKNEFEDGVFDIGIRLPAITFEKKMTIETGADTLIIEKVQADHTDDCCVVFSVNEKVLFFGDCLYVGSDDKKGFYYHREVYLNLLKKLMSYGAEYYIDSHSGVLKHNDMEKMYIKFSELTALIENTPSKEEYLKNIPEILKNSMSAEALDWYYETFRNGMNV
jgi:glyoxylase-like metal-dependent hydrolase (beta-lactamase superfamily II)